MTLPAIEIRDFSLKKGSFSLSHITCAVYPHEMFAILGKTGAGKTLLLEAVAGYYAGLCGAIYINGKAVLDIPLTKRKIGFVYQDYGLFPHMTVEQNISYGLKMQQKNRSVISGEVRRIAGLMSIEHILQQYPETLSGGEKQRTALARALVLSPDVLLLDEPFSALDPVTKKTLHGELLKIHEKFQCAILFVTHDFSEAKELADRIAIMDNGRLMAVRQSSALFEPYEDRTVNQFLGLG
jgi:molybdate transport system ATP-binding protein